MLKTYQRETKLLEFSRDVNTEELKTKNVVTSQWVCCNRFVAMASPKFKNKVPIFTTDYTGKYWSVVKVFLADVNATLPLRTFS